MLDPVNLPKKQKVAPEQSEETPSAGPSAGWLNQQKKKFSHSKVDDIKGWLEGHSSVDNHDIPSGKTALIEFTLKKYHELHGEVDWNLEDFQNSS